MALTQTPSQTVGPFFAYGLTPEQYGHTTLSSIASGDVAGAIPDGERIRIEGRVHDGDGVVVPDAMIEIWQADASGRYAHPADRRSSNAGLHGFGRVGTGTDPDNRFVFNTVKPGPVGDGQAPHINVTLFMRGMPLHAFTRIYFSDEAEANTTDPVLAMVPADRRHTLVAQRQAGTATYVFDIRMQGEHETVFLDP